MGSMGSGAGRSWGAEGEHTSVGCGNQSTPCEPCEGWGAAGRLAQPLWPLDYGMDRCLMGAAALQPCSHAKELCKAGICVGKDVPGKDHEAGECCELGIY